MEFLHQSDGDIRKAQASHIIPGQVYYNLYIYYG